MLAKLYQWRGETFDADGRTLMGATQLTAEDVNDAVSYLGEIGAVEVMGGIGTDPFDFADVKITSKGKRTYHDWSQPVQIEQQQAPSAARQNEARRPVGSPFGFRPADWEFVTERHADRSRLYVVMGLQFASQHYDADILVDRIKACFDSALRSYNGNTSGPPLLLDFSRLAAGYGEHLFNHIARCIIASDIAVFDTSDLNSNVMIELGVALTWGVHVLPIRAKAASPLPSDISGQTWLRYADSGSHFLDQGFDKKLVEMIARAVRGKSQLRVLGAAVQTDNAASAQDKSTEALLVYRKDFEAFLRHLEADWKSERARGPTNVDDARVILETALRGVLQFRAQIARADDPKLPNLLEQATELLKKAARGQIYVDGTKSWKDFWWLAEAALDRLRHVPAELERILTGGAPSKGPPGPNATPPP